ncbi:MAG: iron-sulfur cluster assembly scaffold protein [Pseudomonadota bacterium]
MDSDLTYNALVEDHFRHPRNPADGPCGRAGGSYKGPGEGAVCGRAGSVDRGAWIEFQLQIGADRSVVKAWFRAYGCPHTIALASWLTDYLPGRVLSDNFTLDRHVITEALELPVEKRSSVLVAEDALRACAAAVCGEDVSSDSEVACHGA